MSMQYKAKEDVKMRYKEFQIGNEVMVHLRKEHFSVGTYNKLKMNKFGPYKIVKRHDSRNAYEVEFPIELNISLVFKILNLIEYYEEGYEDEVAEVQCSILATSSTSWRFKRYWRVMLARLQGT